MIPEKKRVCLYVFDQNDGRNTEERLKIAAEDYAVRFNIRAGAEDMFLFMRTERGKPYFPNSPDIGVSVSHSGEYFVCALTQGDVGVDLQEHRVLVSETREEAEARFKRMARRFYHPAEAEFIDSNTFYRFFAIWTAKESYVKYTGQGIDNDFSAFGVLPDEGLAPQSIDSGEPAFWHALGKEFCTQRFGDNYSLCVCTGDPFYIDIIKRS